MNKKLFIMSCTLALCATRPTLANPADMDTTFNSTGTQTVTFAEGDSTLQALGIHANGKIAVAGYVSSTPAKMGVAQLLSNGTLDTSFNTTGTQTVTIFPGENCLCEGMALQSDDSIVLAGYALLSETRYFALARLTPTGALDATFNTTGTQTISFPGYTNSQATECALQTDNKIVVVGNGDDADICVARLNTNGSLDTSFNGTGRAVVPVGGVSQNDDVIIQTDGKIVIADTTNSNAFIARLNTDGTLDTSFGVTGTQDIPSFNVGLHSLALQADGKILVAGYYGTNIKIARLNTNGTLDTSFNGTGTATFTIGTTSEAIGITVQSNGKILITGGTDSGTAEYFVARVLADGSGLDTTFNGTGYKIIDFVDPSYGVDVKLQSDGKIVSAGGSASPEIFSIARQMGDPSSVSCCQMIRDLRWNFLH